MKAHCVFCKKPVSDCICEIMPAKYDTTINHLLYGKLTIKGLRVENSAKESRLALRGVINIHGKDLSPLFTDAQKNNLESLLQSECHDNLHSLRTNTSRQGYRLKQRKVR